MTVITDAADDDKYTADYVRHLKNIRCLCSRPVLDFEG